jgi:DNA processing protein
MVNNSELKYWVGYSKIAGIGRVKIARLLEYFHSMENAWVATASELREAGLDTKTINSIVNSRPRIVPDAEMDKMDKHKVKAVVYTSPDYPQRLKEIYDYPPILYIRGAIKPEDDYCLAIVGTRHATVYGRQVTEDIVDDLVRSNITIVSGLAKGIDSIAHRTALESNGRTIAVFASGLDIVYPAENVRLARAIIEQGALISEYPLGIKPKAEHFPRRNRIMSGISPGVLVVEAGERSGALITAEQALSQNREVFAIPGSILSPASKGTNWLLQQGAKLVRNHVDILEELNLAVVAQQLEMKELLPANEMEIRLFKNLGTEPLHIDEICRQSGLDISAVSSTLTMMELKGMIKQIGYMNYIVAKEMRENYRAGVN